MSNVVILDNIRSIGRQPNLDAKYGPYISLELADSELGPNGPNGDVRIPGLTVGIQISTSEIREYWYQPDLENPGKLILVDKLNNQRISENLVASINVGGVSVGDTYNEGSKIEDILSDLISPLITPTFENPSSNLECQLDNEYEVGSSISGVVATLTYNPGSIKLNGVKKQDRGGLPTRFNLKSDGADVDIELSNQSGLFSIDNLTKSSKGTLLITSYVEYSQGPQPLDSNGDPYSDPLPAGSTLRLTKIIRFILPIYYGVSDISVVSSLDGFFKILSETNTEVRYTTNNQYMVFAYDAEYNNLLSILDQNNLELVSGWKMSEIIYNGFRYKVYVSNFPTTDTNAIFKFKFN